jgi:hypothetical protein
MNSNLRYWTSVLREAERELEAATTRTAMNAAAAKLMTEGEAAAAAGTG